MGVSTICIKDMAGIMGPKEAYDLVSAIKDAVNLPIDLHTHSTTGLAFMTYLKAVEAGVDIIDTAISPFSGGTSQPATETLVYALRPAGLPVRPGRQGAEGNCRLLQAHPGRLCERRYPDAQVHGHRHPVPELSGTRRYDLQPPEPAEDDECAGPL